MITRRSLFTAIAAAAASISMYFSVASKTIFSVEVSRPQWHPLAEPYNQFFIGEVKGLRRSAAEVSATVPGILAAGFVPYEVNGCRFFNHLVDPKSRNGQFSEYVWSGFVKSIRDRHEIIAFEMLPDEALKLREVTA